MRQAVGLLGVPLPLRPHEVLECVSTSPVAGNDVIKIAADAPHVLARVLAHTSVALEDGFAAELGSAKGDLVVVR